MENKNESNPPPRYTWPWFVLGLVALGVVLAIIWMTVLVRRTRDQREYEDWPAQTNSVPKTNSNSIKTNSDSIRS
jgi:hypothetical protein